MGQPKAIFVDCILTGDGAQARGLGSRARVKYASRVKPRLVILLSKRLVAWKLEL